MAIHLTDQKAELASALALDNLLERLDGAMKKSTRKELEKQIKREKEIRDYFDLDPKKDNWKVEGIDHVKNDIYILLKYTFKD